VNELLKALANLPPVKKKIHTVTIQGKTIEVSLEKRLEVNVDCLFLKKIKRAVISITVILSG
jgi:hypothetical protein